MPLAVGHEQQQGTDRSRLIADEREEYLLQCDIERAWADLYSFTLDPCLPVDYTFVNYYHSHSPDSLFAQRRTCTMPTLRGGILADEVLKIREHGAMGEVQVKDEGVCQRLLQEHFGFALDGEFVPGKKGPS